MVNRTAPAGTRLDTLATDRPPADKPFAAAAELKQRVQDRCFRRVDRLCVEMREGRMVVSGRVPSFYLLQIVQAVAGELFSSEQLDFQVTVVSSSAADDC